MNSADSINSLCPDRSPLPEFFTWYFWYKFSFCPPSRSNNLCRCCYCRTVYSYFAAVACGVDRPSHHRGSQSIEGVIHRFLHIRSPLQNAFQTILLQILLLVKFKLDILLTVLPKTTENTNHHYSPWLKISTKMPMTNDSVSKRKINYRFDLKVCRLHLKIADTVATF